MEEGQPELAKVLPFRRRDTETINGQIVHLGLMSQVELTLLETQCQERLEDAKTDLLIVSWHMMTRGDQLLPLQGGAS